MTTGIILLAISLTFGAAATLVYELARIQYNKALKKQEEELTNFMQKIKAAFEDQFGKIPEK